MNTQSRSPNTEGSAPRTEAGRALLDAPDLLLMVMDDEIIGLNEGELEQHILAIEQQARAEGRQQAVREISEYASDEIERGTNPLDAFHRAMRRVAGLNASDSTDTPYPDIGTSPGSRRLSPVEPVDPISGIPEHIMGALASEIAEPVERGEEGSC